MTIDWPVLWNGLTTDEKRDAWLRAIREKTNLTSWRMEESGNILSLAASTDLEISVVYDHSVTYAFQQNAIPILKELRLKSGSIPRKNLRVKITADPLFIDPFEIRVQSLEADQEFISSSIDLKLSASFLAGLNEKVGGLLRFEVFENEVPILSKAEPISLLASNEWCGLRSLPEILAAFVLPNDPAVMTILSRASEILGETTGRTALNGYQDKSRRRAWEQAASIYRAIAELKIRYIVAPASFETTGQKVRFPTEIVGTQFGNCLDLSLLFAACCEQSGLHPLILMHEGHAYSGCWLEQRTLPEPAIDDLQTVRKLVELQELTVLESTVLTGMSSGTLPDSEKVALAHLDSSVPFHMALDIRRSRIARIHPLPIPGQPQAFNNGLPVEETMGAPLTLGDREILEPSFSQDPVQASRPANRIDQWKSRLLDLSLRNRLLNFKETKGTIPLLSADPEHVEDELADNTELRLLPKPAIMGGDDPRNAATYSQQQKADALVEHLKDELKNGRLRLWAGRGRTQPSFDRIVPRCPPCP